MHYALFSVWRFENTNNIQINCGTLDYIPHLIWILLVFSIHVWFYFPFLQTLLLELSYLLFGFKSRSELGLEPGGDPGAVYNVGQVVKCRVISSIPASRRINLSLIIKPTRFAYILFSALLVSWTFKLLLNFLVYNSFEVFLWLNILGV